MTIEQQPERLVDQHVNGIIEHGFVWCTVGASNAQSNYENMRRQMDTARAMEDVAFVLSEVEELTPAQTAMVAINANIAVAGTDKDASEVMPQKLTMEEFKQGSMAAVVATAKGFSAMWEQVLSNLHSITTLNKAAKVKLDMLLEQLKRQQAQTDTLALSTQEQVIELGEIPSILRIHAIKESDDYLKELQQCRTNFNALLQNTTVKCATSVRTLVHDGMTVFKTHSTRAALEGLKEHRRSFSALPLRVATEDVQTSADGLVIDVVLTGGYALATDTDEDIPQLMKLAELEMATEAHTLVGASIFADLIAEAEANIETLALSTGAANVLSDATLAEEVKSFGDTVESILAALPVLSNTKDVVFGYCDLFLDAVHVANSEISFMTYMTRFIVAYTELLEYVANKVQQANPDQNPGL